MLVITPVAASDEAHFEAFVEVMEHLGPYPDDPLMVVVTPEAMDIDAFKPLIHRYRNLFGNPKDSLRVTPNTPEGGWPLAPSLHFMWAINEFQHLPGRQDFYYLETDVTALVKGWLMRIKQDYIQHERPYYGIVRDTWRLGKLKTPKDSKNPDIIYAKRDGTHMVGTGIYPRDYTTRPLPQQLTYLDEQVIPNHSQGMVSIKAPSVNCLWNKPSALEPFDIRCQSYHKPVHNSLLMEHRWHTAKYRIEDGKLICDNSETPQSYPILGDGDRVTGEHIVDYSGEVPISRRVVLHGCKDGSLAKLVLSGELAELMVFLGENPMSQDEERDAELRLVRDQLAQERKARLALEEGIMKKSAPTGLMHNKRAESKKVFAEVPE